jgi:hypothetical protein
VKERDRERKRKREREREKKRATAFIVVANDDVVVPLHMSLLTLLWLLLVIAAFCW